MCVYVYQYVNVLIYIHKTLSIHTHTHHTPTSPQKSVDQETHVFSQSSSHHGRFP